MIRSVTTFICLFLLLAVAAHAQITITKTDVESGFVNAKRTTYGHTFTSGTFPTVNLYNVAASTQSFDFSLMPAGDTRDTSIQDYVPPAGLPGASNFPGATVGTMVSSSPFTGASITFVEFMSIENDGVYGLGNYMHQVFPPFLDTAIVTKYRPKRMYFPLPMTYGTSRTFQDTVLNDASTGEYEVTVRSFTVDGFGTINFPPAGEIPVLAKVASEQCLRVITDDNISVYDGGNNFIGSGHTREVEFIAASSTFLSVGVDDTNYTTGSTAVTSRSLNFKSGTTGVTPVPTGVPGEFSLKQNYPNPFNPSTKITFALPTQSYVSMKVYDILGREIATLASGDMNAGSYTVDFDAARLSAGLYFCRLTAGNVTSTMKMSLVK